MTSLLGLPTEILVCIFKFDTKLILIGKLLCKRINQTLLSTFIYNLFWHIDTPYMTKKIAFTTVAVIDSKWSTFMDFCYVNCDRLVAMMITTNTNKLSVTFVVDMFFDDI